MNLVRDEEQNLIQGIVNNASSLREIEKFSNAN